MSNEEPERWVQTRRQESARQDIGRSIDAVRNALEKMQFGSITLTIHESRVVQLDVTEKRRFAN